MKERIFYLYRHINLTSGQPFYIGVGEVIQEKKTHEARYRRAFEKTARQRNEYWIELVKSIEYRVEILLHSPSECYIYQKEIEFIDFYGREILGEGPLVNIARGGKGVSGAGKRRTGERTLVFTYDNQGRFFKKFETYRSCAKYFNVTPDTVSRQVKGRGFNMSMKGHIFLGDYFGEFFFDFEKYFEKIVRPGECNKKGISYLDAEMILIKHFDSLKEGAEYYDIGRDAVQSYSDNGRPDSLGNYWRKDGETRVFHEHDIMGNYRHGGPPYEPVYAYKIDTGEFFGQYGSIHEAARETNCPRGNISCIMKGKGDSRTVNGLTFFPEHQGDNVGKVRFGKTKRVGRFEKGVLVEEFNSAIEAGEKFGLNPKSIRGYCGNHKRSGSLTAKWRFLN